MSGPKAVEYTVVDALLDAAWDAYQSHQRRREEEARQAEAAAERRREAQRAAAQKREEERRAREEARRRAERAAELAITARGQEQRLARAHALAGQARAKYPDIPFDLPNTPAPPKDLGDPAAIERYVTELVECVRAIEATIRSQGTRAAAQQGLAVLMESIATTIADDPRTAGDLLASYANEVRAMRASPRTETLDRQATAERILGRLASIDAGAVPPALDKLMRAIIEADTDERAELLAMELRAQVQRFNTESERAAAAAKEDRKREIVGVMAAEVLSDLGYEVEPIAETLFVKGGVAHFQRAEWGDYFVRMRVDPANSSINFNMVRTTTDSGPPDPAQRRRDEEMEAAWCAGLPKILAELAARGINTSKVRALDPGAVPVQIVKPDVIDPVMRAKGDERPATAPREMARPIK